MIVLIDQNFGIWTQFGEATLRVDAVNTRSTEVEYAREFGIDLKYSSEENGLWIRRDSEVSSATKVFIFERGL